MTTSGYKRCTQCGETKPLEGFHRHRLMKDGRRSRCKPCENANVRAWNKANRESRNAYYREWRKKNPEKAAKKNERRRQWGKENAEKVALAQKLWHERNPEYGREWRKRNPERVRERNERWAEANPEKAWAHGQLRRAVYAGKIEKPSKCEGCGREVPKAKLDGHHEDYSKPFDVEWLCRTCHRKTRD